MADSTQGSPTPLPTPDATAQQSLRWKYFKLTMWCLGILLAMHLLAAHVIVPMAWARFYARHPALETLESQHKITKTGANIPGDPLNLALMAVPMILFYEIGIILARILGKKRPEAAAGA